MVREILLADFNVCIIPKQLLPVAHWGSTSILRPPISSTNQDSDMGGKRHRIRLLHGLAPERGRVGQEQPYILFLALLCCCLLTDFSPTVVDQSLPLICL